MSAPLQPAVMSVAQFTRWACISRAKTYMLISDGSLRTFKLGSRRLIRVADAETWLANLHSEGLGQISQ